jgi:hypothetical protein
MYRGVIVAALISLSACATVGREIKQDQLADFKKGVTTPEEVVAKLGNPISSSVNSTGVRSLVYVFAHAQARPASFIPFIGPFVGGTDSRSSSVVFVFGADGKMLDYHASQSQMGTGTGFSSGTYQQPDYSQPQEAAKQ